MIKVIVVALFLIKLLDAASGVRVHTRVPKVRSPHPKVHNHNPKPRKVRVPKVKS